MLSRLSAVSLTRRDLQVGCRARAYTQRGSWSRVRTCAQTSVDRQAPLRTIIFEHPAGCLASAMACWRLQCLGSARGARAMRRLQGASSSDEAQCHVLGASKGQSKRTGFPLVTV